MKPKSSIVTATAAWVPATKLEELASQEPRATEPTVASVSAPEPGVQPSMRAPESGTATRLRMLAEHNRSAAAQLASIDRGPMSLQGREGPKPSNLPIRNAAGDAIAASEAASAAKRAAARAASGVGSFAKKRWVKVGVQPAAGGFVLHTEHWEGDVKLKETVQRNLSPLAVREKLSLHLAAVFSVF